MSTAEHEVQQETETEMVKAKPVKVKKEKTDDLLVQIVQEISGLNAVDAINEVPTLLNGADENYFRLGGVLSIISSHKFYEADGFETFRAFVEQKHDIKYRKAMYWIDIYEKLVESGVSWNKVSTVGWTKLKDLAKILTVDNVDEWVTRALSMTTLQLQEAIAKASAGTLADSGLTPEDDKPSEVTTFTVKVHTLQKANINEAIEKAKIESNTEFAGTALDNICTNYLAGGNVTPMALVDVLKKYTPEDALMALEQVYPDMDLTVKVKKSA
jgi:hypothetical protein